MNKTVIIIGGVALVGVVAYFYFKPKLTATTGAGEMGTGTTGTGTTGASAGTTGATMPPAGTVLTTPEEVEAITIKISSARDLTKTICDLKKQYKITEDEMNDFMNITGWSGGVTSGIHTATNDALTSAVTLSQLASRRKLAVKTVAESINKLKELGYKEVDCKMVKIA